jgi:hypothetical protein
MDIAANLPFEQLLVLINQLNAKEKQTIAKLLIEETDLSEEQSKEAINRKKDFEKGKISTESWSSLKKRILN